MKIEKSYDEKELYLRLNNLRGLCALVVMFSHIWWFSGCVIKGLLPFNKIVTIAVAGFFFLSGYGMMRSYEKKENYLKRVWGKILVLLYKAASAYIVAAIMEYSIVMLCDIKFKYYTPFGLLSLIRTTNWYVYELTGFYLAFIIVMHIAKGKWQLVCMCIVTALAFILLYYSGAIEGFYSSIFGYIFGMFCYKYSYLKWTQKLNWIFVSAVLILFTSFASMFILDKTTIYFACIRNLAAIAAIILILYLVKYINLTNKFTIFLSRISPELYFYHLFISRLLILVINNIYLYAVSVVIISTALAILINRLDKRIIKLIKRGIRTE